MSAYIFNTCVIPRIEYRGQLTVLTEQECESLIKPYRKALKHKLKFTSTAPNVIIDSNLLYKIKTISQNQSESKINNFFIQINDTGLLGES